MHMRIVRLLTPIHEELQLKTGFPMPFNTTMYALGEAVNISLQEKRQFDGLEFLQRLLERIAEQSNDATFIRYVLSPDCGAFDLQRAWCNAGRITTTSIFRVRMPDWEQAIQLSSLLWDAAACQCSIDNNSPGCECNERNSKWSDQISENEKLPQGMYYIVTMLIDAPPLLMIETNRVIGCIKQGNINRSPIIVEERIESCNTNN